MKAADFTYARPDTVAEAVALLAAHPGEARVLAGGQSLLPMMNLRLARPGVLVDINRIAALRGITLNATGLHVGALVRHGEAASHPLVAQAAPLLVQALAHVAHPVVRNRGTLCGSLAHADPAAELPACALVLRAVLHIQGPAGRRDAPASEFFRGLFATSCAEDEILTGFTIPPRDPDEIHGFDEFSRRRGDFAMVGVAASARCENSTIRALRLVVFGTEPVARTCAAASDASQARAWSAASAAPIAAVAAASLAMDNVPAEEARARRMQASVLARRVLTRMFNDEAAR